MAYIPNATDATQPVESQTVESAALEFRTLKTSVSARVAAVQAELDDTQATLVDDELRITVLEQLAFNGSTPGAAVYKEFIADGLSSAFTLDVAPLSVATVDVFVNGLALPFSEISVAGLVVTLDGTLDAGDEVVIKTAVPLAIGTTTADAVEYTPTGTGAVATTVQSKLRESVSVGDKGIISDGATDQTSALVSLMASLSSFRGWINIPYNTKFTVSTVYAAVPVGVILNDESSINWGQPPGYKNKFRIMYSGDSVSDDTVDITASGHHPAIALLNTGTSGTASGANRYASIMHGVGRSYTGDILQGWFQQFGKTGSSVGWNVGWRIQTPYAVAIKNPQLWLAATLYGAGAYCVSDSGKIYTTTLGGTSGSTAPTGTGKAINDGGALWDYAEANLIIDSTVFNFDEGGNLRIAGRSGTPTITQVAGAKSHYFSINASNGNIVWRDISRALNIATVTDTAGFQFGMAQSPERTNVTGTGPDAPLTGAGKVNNASATSMSTMAPPSGKQKMIVSLRFDNSNTTVIHGAGANALTLKGAVNVTPAVGQFMVFEYDSTLSPRWFEVSRSF